MAASPPGDSEETTSAGPKHQTEEYLHNHRLGGIANRIPVLRHEM
jgi:hypothetical protein